MTSALGPAKSVCDIADGLDRDAVGAAARRLLRFVPTSSVAAGRERFAEGGVLRVILHRGGTLSASVASSRGRPFHVQGRLSLPPSRPGTITDLGCTCGWQHRCKHVAAVLVALVEALATTSTREHESAPPSRTLPAATGSSVDPAVARWLAAVASDPPHQERLSTLAFELHVDGTSARVLLAEERRQPRGGTRLVALELAASVRAALGAIELQPAEVAAPLRFIAWSAKGRARLVGAVGAHALRLLLASGRLFLAPPALGLVIGGSAAPRALTGGPERVAKPSWRTAGDLAVPILVAEGVTDVLATLHPVHYVDRTSGCIGELTTAKGPDFARRWATGPPLARASASAVHAELRAVVPDLPAPFEEVVDIREMPIGVLRLRGTGNAHPLDRAAELSFRYGPVLLTHGTPAPGVTRIEQRAYRVHRAQSVEEDLLAVLLRCGLYVTSASRPGEATRLEMSSESAWLWFLAEDAPRLRADGFEIVVDPDFALSIVEVEDWTANLEESDNQWFELAVGIQVGGARVDVLPALLAAFRPGAARRERVWIALGKGKHASIPTARLEPLAEVLLELAARPGGKPQVSRIQAMDLAHAARLEGATWTALRALRSALVSEQRASAPELPETFRGSLRPYQADGVARLTLLGTVGLGALLADDMGLGKTVQIIALLCLLRASRPRSAPSLVVAPKSATISWIEQLEAFAPTLAVVVWQGPDRARSRGALDGADVVVTSYAILQRDAEELTGRAWDVVVLDEAQAIKNPMTTHATNASRLDARQRIALTGTPVENHLGELWSIVGFAVPGALGSKETFRSAYRTPIEKGGDGARLASLRRRLAPILIRRTKEEVATELPPKNVIRVPVELGEPQRDLYEAVRVSVKRAVQDAIAARGFDRARIMILDALLKLRQVCCDPRLLKVATLARRRVASAKLESFRDLIETLVDEGRRVLVFSQFTEMLDLVAEEVADLGVEHATLTGSTRDRRAEVERFRSGRVPLFLISLKAGGTGLNLTAADTVVHYDPWWNPAVEDQATDRAHRIGQTRPVMVYKLVARGTIEEKILALQEKKAELARSLLDGGGKLGAWLDAATLDDLLAPMPSNAPRGGRARRGG